MNRRWLALAAALICTSAFSQVQPLYVVPLEDRAGATLKTHEPLRLALHSRDTKALAAQLNVAAPASGPVEYVLNPYRPPKDVSSRTWREATFVVDFADRHVADLYEELLEAESSTPTRAQLVNFVASTLKPTLGRGWDMASTIAERREGDCTEFAVTVTALARAAAREARIVTGIVIVRTPQGPAAMGHAWSELKEDNQWRVADAALPQAQVIGYIPLGALNDESASFTLDLARLLQTWVQRVEVIGGPPPSSR